MLPVVISYVIVPVRGCARSGLIHAACSRAHIDARALSVFVAVRDKAGLRALAYNSVREIGRKHYSVLVIFI